MAYKFQEGAAKLDGAISGSSTIIAKSSISASGDIAVTGAAHAAQFYGGGANLTGISADAIDVTASTGDINYPIVFTQGAQSNGSLGLGLNTALNYNPSDGIVSSSAKAQFVGNSVFGGTLGVSGAMTIAGISGSGHAEFVTGVRTAGGLEVSGATTLAANLSSSAQAQIVGNSIFGGQLSVSGNVTLAGTGDQKISGKVSSSAAGGATFVGSVTAIGQIESSASVLGAAFVTNDVTYGDSGVTMDADGGNLLFINNDADQQIYLKVGSDTAATSVTFINASSQGLFSVDGTGQMSAAAISGSGVMQVVGTVNSIGAMASSGSITAGSSFIIGSADLNETDMEKLDGITNGAGAANKALVLDGNADVASGLRSVTASADLKAANIHATQFYGGGAGLSGVTVTSLSGTTVQLTTGLDTSGYLKVSGSTTLAGTGSMSDINMSGALSGSGELMWVGHARFADEVNVTGAVSGASTLEIVGTVKSIGAIASSGSITAGSSFIIGSADLNEADMEKLDGITNGAGAANKALVLDGNADVASGLRSVTASADLKAANIHATQFYGGGAGITGISSDAVDVTASSGDINYPIVFTQGAQSNGSLGLGLNTALNYNPNDGLLSSSAGAEFVGASRFVGALGVTGAATLASTLDVTGLASLDGGVDVNGSNFTVGTDGATTMTSLSVQTGDIGTFANISGSGVAQFGGNTFLGAALNVTGVASLDGGINVNDAYTVSTAGAVVANEFKTDGNEFVVSTAGLVTTTGITNAGAIISSSAALQVVANSIFGGDLDVSGGFVCAGVTEMEGAQVNNVTVVTANAELTASTSTMMQIVSGGTSAVTMIIPSASHSGYTYMIKRHSNMSGNVVVTGSGGDAAAGYFIDGEDSVTLETAGASIFLVSDGTNWNIF